MIPNANGKPARRSYHARMAKFREGVDDALPHLMLSWVEEQEFLKFLSAFGRNLGGENKVHERFLAWTRFQSSPTELMGVKSAARRLTP